MKEKRNYDTYLAKKKSHIRMKKSLQNAVLYLTLRPEYYFFLCGLDCLQHLNTALPPNACYKSHVSKEQHATASATFGRLARCYVTLITARAEFEDESFPLPPLSVLMHCPVNWFTLRGLLMSWGFVPTGLRCSGGPAGGGW